MKIGFIGTGKITSSIIYGIFKSKLKNSKIYISPRNRTVANKLSKKFRSVKIAKDNFTFLDNCKADLEIITGDARIKLNEAKNHIYDVIFVISKSKTRLSNF